MNLISSQDVVDATERKMLVDISEEEMDELSEKLQRKFKNQPEYVMMRRSEISIGLYEEYILR
ncbi:MAG: hypothetical protein QW829_01845 [Candidatus Bathyarchaeia archaeon]